MHFPVEGTRKTLVFFTILTSWTIGFGESSGDKTLNLRIGFDLTQGTNGAPALRIRDFDDSDASEVERRPRAEDKEEEEMKASPAIRADSFSDEDKNTGRNEDSSKAEERDVPSSDGSNDSGDSGQNRHRSTKGGAYEPEEDTKVHGRYQEDDSEDNNNDRRRRKRREVDYEGMKRKSKKFRSARKQGVTIGA